jgi:hypothetical protein
MMSEIHTGVPLEEEQGYLTTDLEQPLLQRRPSTFSSDNDSTISSSNDRETKVHSCWYTQFIANGMFLHGFWLGFLIQVVSLGSTAILAIYFGGKEKKEQLSSAGEVYYVVFFILSQAWWLLFPIICLAIDGGLKGDGDSIFERCFFSKSISPSSSSTTSRRDIFMGGIRFHVGIVFGCFVVWSLIDFYFGASMKVFVTLFISFIACLSLCCGMVIIHDRYILEENERTQRS